MNLKPPALALALAAVALLFAAAGASFGGGTALSLGWYGDGYCGDAEAANPGAAGDCWYGAAERDCGDLVDNDSDERTDCLDPDCTAPGSVGSVTCGRGTPCEPSERDADGDCAEDTYFWSSACGDSIDNDGDGQADCADSDCAQEPSCQDDSCPWWNPFCGGPVCGDGTCESGESCEVDCVARIICSGGDYCNPACPEHNLCVCNPGAPSCGNPDSGGNPDPGGNPNPNGGNPGGDNPRGGNPDPGGNPNPGGNPTVGPCDEVDPDDGAVIYRCGGPSNSDLSCCDESQGCANDPFCAGQPVNPCTGIGFDGSIEYWCGGRDNSNPACCDSAMDCGGFAICGGRETACADAQDNDDDGAMDQYDSDCADFYRGHCETLREAYHEAFDDLNQKGDECDAIEADPETYAPRTWSECFAEWQDLNRALSEKRQALVAADCSGY